MSSYTYHIGQMGEGLAIDYLKRHEFKIWERNYRKRYGEVDIIAEKDKAIHFIEVKTRSKKVNHTGPLFPEESVTEVKQKKLLKTARSYLAKKRLIPEATDWQVDIIAIVIDWGERKAKVRFFPKAVVDF